MNRLAAVGLILMIGAAPLCACPSMAAPPPAAHEPACCRENPDHPSPPPATSCEHCPIMNPAHMVLDQAATLPPLHCIAWTTPIRWMPAIAAPSEFAPSPHESPPTQTADLYHLHCLLTL